MGKRINPRNGERHDKRKYSPEEPDMIFGLLNSMFQNMANEVSQNIYRLRRST